MSDAADAADIAALLHAYDVQAFVVPFEPLPQGRPRANKRTGSVYKLQSDEDAEERTRAVYRGAVAGPRLRNVAFGAIFYRSTQRAVDPDNLLKHALDAGKGVLWSDDSQVTAMVGFVAYDHDNPRTVVLIGEHDSTMLRGTAAHPPCLQCGRPVPYERIETGTCTVRCEKARAAEAQPDLFGS